MKSNKRLRIVLGILTLLGGALLAWVASAYTPLARDQLNGQWEAVVVDEPRIFVARLGTKDSFIAMVAGDSAHPDVSIFKLRKLVLEDGGVVYIEGMERGGMVLKVRGRGRGKRTAGRIVADIELWDTQKDIGPTVFSTTFESRGSPTYLETLVSLAQAAQQAAAPKSP